MCEKNTLMTDHPQVHLCRYNVQSLVSVAGAQDVDVSLEVKHVVVDVADDVVRQLEAVGRLSGGEG